MSLYTISDKVISATKEQKFMDPGVHTNVTLIDVKAEESANGNMFLAYYWQNEQGQIVSKTEYKVNTKGNLPFARLKDEDKETYLNMVNNQMRRILYVAKQFVPEEELKDKAFANYKEFCLFVKSKLTPDKYAGIKLRLKVVYDKDGWCTVPSYVREVTAPWIERVDKVSDEDTKMCIVSGIDRTVRENNKSRTKPAAKSMFADDANDRLGTFEDAKIAKDDLPF